MSDNVMFSVVMPLHCGEQWIGATLDSLVAAGCGAKFQIIMIDSSPTLDTQNVVEPYRRSLQIEFIRRPDVKSWQAKTNLAVTIAKADHVAMLHQDDVWLPCRMEAMRHWMERFPAADLHLAPTEIIDSTGCPQGRWTCPLPAGVMLPSDVMIERLLVQNFVSVPAPLIRRKAWLDVGGLDEELWYTADWDLWLKLARRQAVVYHRETTTGFRVHGSSLTVRGSQDAAAFRQQMDLVLERHRSALQSQNQTPVIRRARASIAVNSALAGASGGAWRPLISALLGLAALGPVGLTKYVRDSRIYERVSARLRARRAGRF